MIDGGDFDGAKAYKDSKVPKLLLEETESLLGLVESAQYGNHNSDWQHKIR